MTPDPKRPEDAPHRVTPRYRTEVRELGWFHLHRPEGIAEHTWGFDRWTRLDGKLDVVLIDGKTRAYEAVVDIVYEDALGEEDDAPFMEFTVPAAKWEQLEHFLCNLGLNIVGLAEKLKAAVQEYGAGDEEDTR